MPVFGHIQLGLVKGQQVETSSAPFEVFVCVLGMTNPILVVVQVSISPWNSGTLCLMHPYYVYMKLLFYSCSQLEWSSGSSCVLNMALIQVYVYVCMNVCVCVLEGGAQLQVCPIRLPSLLY